MSFVARDAEGSLTAAGVPFLDDSYECCILKDGGLSSPYFITFQLPCAAGKRSVQKAK